MAQSSLQTLPNATKRSSASQKPFRFRQKHILTVVLPLLGLFWGLYFALGKAAGKLIAGRWPETVSRLGGSKLPDLSGYVTHRLFDGLYLATLTLCVLVATAIVTRWLYLRLWKRSLLSFLWITCFLFVVANLWCYGAGRAALFWLILRGPTVQNQAQFKVKELLLDEVKDRPVVALVGSSQARAQINEEKFNERMGKRLWMMELHFPGSLAADVYYVSRRWDKDQVDGFLFYLSPLTFYAQNGTSIGRDLLRLRDLPEWTRCGGWTQAQGMTRRYVALGALMPLFQARSPLQHALFGFVRPADIAIPLRQEAPAHREASTIQLSDNAEYQKALFLKLLESTLERNQKIILVIGQFNPLQEAKMAPEVRPAFEEFVRACAERFPHVILVNQDEIFLQGPSAYNDATHVTEETGLRFTEAFCKWLQRHEAENGPFLTPSAAAAR